MCVVNVGTVDVRRVRTLRLWLSCVPSAGLGLPAVPRDRGQRTVALLAPATDLCACQTDTCLYELYFSTVAAKAESVFSSIFPWRFPAVRESAIEFRGTGAAGPLGFCSFDISWAAHVTPLSDRGIWPDLSYMYMYCMHARLNLLKSFLYLGNSKSQIRR